MKKENARESFVFYRSFYEAVKNLPDDIRGEILSALMEYALNGVEPENLSGIARGYMILMKPQIDANNRRYNNGCRPKKKSANPDQTIRDNNKTSSAIDCQPIDNQNMESSLSISDNGECLPPDNFEPTELPETATESPTENTLDIVTPEPVQPAGLNDDILTDDESARFQLLFPHTHRNREFLFFIK